MSCSGDLSLRRLSNYSTSAMPVTSRLSYSSYSPRTSTYRGTSLERGSYSPLSTKLSSVYTSYSRPPLPGSSASSSSSSSSDFRRRYDTSSRASSGVSARRDPPAPFDMDSLGKLTEARKYLMERRAAELGSVTRPRYSRTESRDVPELTPRSERGSFSRSAGHSRPDSVERVSERILCFESRSSSSSGYSSTAGAPAASPVAARRRVAERLVPIQLESEQEAAERPSPRRPSVSELRRQFDRSSAAAGAASSDDDSSSTLSSGSQAASPAREALPAARRAASPAREAPPRTRRAASPVREAPPPARRAVSPAREAPPPARHVASPAREAPPPARRAASPAASPTPAVPAAPAAPAPPAVTPSPAAAAAAPTVTEPSARMVGGRATERERPHSPATLSPPLTNGLTNGHCGRHRPSRDDAGTGDQELSLLISRKSALQSESSAGRRPRTESCSSLGGGPTDGPTKDDTVRLGPQDGLTGLRNIGNTCFMNSVLQCLSNTRALHEYILRDGCSAEINSTTSSMKGALVQAFGDLMKDLWQKTDETDRVVTTAPFKSQIQRFAPRFMGYQQQDAQEFLRYLLEGLHEDVNRVVARPRPITDDIDDNLSDAQKAMESWKRFMRFDNSKFVDLFVGQLKSTLRCTVCGNASVTFDPFWDLSLPIPAKTGQVRLQACFDLFTKEEVLDGDEKPTCDKCKKRQKCTKSFSIQKFPRILVVHLKRFSPHERYRGKLNSVVDFPLCGLDLSPYSEGQGPCKYSLYGVANHSGTLYSGHYTAYCRHPYSAEWREYNDSRIRTVSMRSVVSNEAYVLFFELANASSL